MPNIGERNRLIQIWKPTGVVDAANEPLPDAWVKFKEKWADVLGQSGMGSIKGAASAGGINTDIAQYSFRVNYDLSLDVTMQIRDKTTRYDIVGVRHDKATREWTDLIAVEGGPYGKPQSGS